MGHFKASEFIDTITEYVRNYYGEDLHLDGLKEMCLDVINRKVSDDLLGRVERLDLFELRAVLEAVDARLGTPEEKPKLKTKSRASDLN